MSISPMPPFDGDVSGQAAVVVEPKPPGLHWALLLLVDLGTAGTFEIVWCFVQASFARKIDSNAALWRQWWLGIAGVPVATRMILGPAPAGQTIGLFYGSLSMVCSLLFQMGISASGNRWSFTMDGRARWNGDSAGEERRPSRGRRFHTTRDLASYYLAGRHIIGKRAVVPETKHDTPA